MAASSDDSPESTNMFLAVVELRRGQNVIVDSNRLTEASYYIKDAETIDHIGPLDSMSLTEKQVEAFIQLQNTETNASFNLNLSIPVMMQNITDIIIDRHVPGFCEDFVVIQDNMMVEVFMVGIFADKIKHILMLQDKGNRKFMIFISLNSACAQGVTLSRAKSIGLSELKSNLFKNNMAIRETFWNLVVDPKPMICDAKRLAHSICVGEIRIVMSPNYILNYYSTIAYENPLKYFLKLTVHNLPQTDEHRRVTRFIPLSLMSVNKKVYLDVKNSLDIRKLSINKEENDLEDKLKINPDILIGVPNFDSFKNIDFPVYRESDYMTISFIVCMNDESRRLREPEKIPIGNLLSSSSTINNYFLQTISLIEGQLTRRVPVEHILGIREEFLFKSTKLFESNYYDSRMIEKRVPILTPLEMMDLYVHYNQDCKLIMENNRHMAPTYKHDGVNSITTSQSIMKHLPSELKMNGRFWIDCYWESYNRITKQIFDEWMTSLFEFSHLARESAAEFFLKRDLYPRPTGMSLKVFQKYIDDEKYIVNPTDRIRKFIRLKIFSDLVSEDIDDSFLIDTFRHFKICSNVPLKIEEEIKRNQEWKRIYMEESAKLDPARKLKQASQDMFSKVPQQGIPITAILTDICVEINIEFMNYVIHTVNMFPPNIANDLSNALNIMNILKTNQCGHYSITINTKKHPEFLKYVDLPTFYDSQNQLHKFFTVGESSAEGSIDPAPVESKENEIIVKIFTLKNFNEHFKKK